MQVIILVTLITLTAFVGAFFHLHQKKHLDQNLAQTNSEQSDQKTELKQSSIEISDDSDWILLSAEERALLPSFKPITIKVIFQAPSNEDSPYFLASKKRTHKKKNRGDKKNKKLEFPGGNVEENEHPFETLTRELNEEDNSQLLASILLEQLEAEEVHYRNIVLKNKERMTLVHCLLTGDQKKKFDDYTNDHEMKNRETYGFFWYTLEDFEDSSIWTEKSKKIFKRLKKK